MQSLRFLMACMSMLACLGVSYADARLGPTPGHRVGTRLKVEICVPNPEKCGPREKANASTGQLGVRYPPYTKRAAVIKSPHLNIRCPGTCAKDLPGARPVTLTAEPKVDRSKGSYEFVEWTGKKCAGQRETCTFHIERNENVTVSAVFKSYSPVMLGAD